MGNFLKKKKVKNAKQLKQSETASIKVLTKFSGLENLISALFSRKNIKKLRFINSDIQFLKDQKTTRKMSLGSKSITVTSKDEKKRRKFAIFTGQQQEDETVNTEFSSAEQGEISAS